MATTFEPYCLFSFFVGDETYLVISLPYSPETQTKALFFISITNYFSFFFLKSKFGFENKGSNHNFHILS